MNDPFPNYQPDDGIARRKGENPRPAIPVDRPIAMKMRMTMRPNTQHKHYRRKKATPTPYDERKRIFY